MTQKDIRIGIIGANSTASWAMVSHIPAIQSLRGVKLAAVATRSEQSAREAAEAFGADHWYSDPYAMIRDDQVDLVTVAVNVHAHRDLVLAALEAGKAVYCEAPLARNLAETEELARAARSNHTAIGLQARHNPTVRRAAELVSSGRIGRPLNARIVAQTLAHGPEMPIQYDYCNKLASGANHLTIVGGHTLDVVEAVLAPISEVDARTETRWPKVKLTETGEESTREVPDWVGVLGKTRSGAAFTADIEAGVPPEDVRFSFEVMGSEGWLTLTSTHPFGVQAGDLTLTSNVAFAPPEKAVSSGGIGGAAINVGELYAHLVRDMHAGAHTTPGFEHALHNARLIEAVRRAAERGERQYLTD